MQPNPCPLDQWFSTFGGWRPKKLNIAQFGDPYVTILVQNSGFGDPRVSACDPKVGRDPPVDKHCSRPLILNVESMAAHQGVI